jgi:DNA-binding NtrC family response regulator
MMVSFLFDFFHFFINAFDRLIQDQISEGNTPIKVAFADEAFSFMKKRGFNKEEMLHFFALCFQMRRAFYFIDRGLVGRSNCMKKMRESLWNNVFTYDIDLYNQYLWNRMEDFSTLILGETGTGKGAAARAIGRSGFIPFDEKKKCFKESFTGNFISMNLSQFSENLIESELFGHKKGAFTGAVEDHKGVFDRCSPHGAIFLDEIGEVMTPVQIKLLKVLEERVFSPVGSHEEHRFEGRVIAATNRPIDEVQNRALFRSDFFYRLCSDIIIVPPLRERINEDPGELDDLLASTVERIVGQPSPELAEIVRKSINSQLGKGYLWPGNVRELGQCVRRILLKQTYTYAQYPSITGSDSKLACDIEQGSINAQDLLKEYCRLLYDKHGTYGEVSRITKLDRRTVKKHIDN